MFTEDTFDTTVGMTLKSFTALGHVLVVCIERNLRFADSSSCPLKQFIKSFTEEDYSFIKLTCYY